MIKSTQFNMERLLDYMLDEGLNQNRDLTWRWHAEIIEEYLPSHPRKYTTPECVVKFGESFLRYSLGPKQGFFWDMYGDDFHSPELALMALMQAPTPPDHMKIRDLPREPEADKIERGKRLMLEDMLGCFYEAGFGTLTYIETPNRYCGPTGCSICASHPWLVVNTKMGMVTVGWRKRVIVIDWSESNLKTEAWQLFNGENVTMGNRMIHAWGYTKAKEYLAKLLVDFKDPTAQYKPDASKKNDPYYEPRPVKHEGD